MPPRKPARKKAPRGAFLKSKPVEYRRKVLRDNPGVRPGDLDLFESDAPPPPKAKCEAKPTAAWDRMNKTEQEYAMILKSRKAAGEVAWFAFEPWGLRLADNTRYNPDFVVLMADGTIEVHEVKGFWRDDARVKFKTAANLYPFLIFRAVQKARKKDGGGWIVETLRQGD